MKVLSEPNTVSLSVIIQCVCGWVGVPLLCVAKRRREVLLVSDCRYAIIAGVIVNTGELATRSSYSQEVVLV